MATTGPDLSQQRLDQRRGVQAVVRPGSVIPGVREQADTRRSSARAPISSDGVTMTATRSRPAEGAAVAGGRGVHQPGQRGAGRGREGERRQPSACRGGAGAALGIRERVRPGHAVYEPSRLQDAEQ